MARLRGFPSVLAALTVGALTVTGVATFAATVTATGQFLATAGTDGAPGYAFAAGTTVGMRLGVADSLRFVGGGAVFAVMDANGITTALNGTFTGYVQASSFLTSGGYGRFGAPSDGVVVLSGASTTDFGRLCFGGTTSAFPAWKRSGAELHARLADDSATCDVVVHSLNAAAEIQVAGAKVVASRGAAVADATGAGDVVAQFNTLLARLRVTGGHGLIAD